MIELDAINYSFYSNTNFLNEDTESYKEDQARKKVSDFKNSLGTDFGQEYDPLILRSLKEREIRHLQTSPLLEFKEKLAELSEGMNFGVHFHGIGKGLVKGENLAFRTKIVNGEEMTELDFKVNHVFRSKIQSAIDDLSWLDTERAATILSLMGSHGKGILVEHNQPFPLGNAEMGKASKLSVANLGSIYIGATPDLPTMYNRVVVHMGADKNIYDFHELLAFLDLDPSLHLSEKEDLDRLKIGHLFRTFYPREALPLERSEDFFHLPIDQLITKIVEDVPEMQDIFDVYLDQMTPEEILPGRLRYRIHGLAKKAYELGARGLTAAITGVYSNAEQYERIVSILKLGMLSSEVKKEIGLNATGMSASSDFYSGGADSVFTQMITEKNCHDGMNFSDLHYNSDIRLLISLDALEMGSYQYFDDGFGNRKLESYYWDCDYSLRPGIFEFVDQLQSAESQSEKSSLNYLVEEIISILTFFLVLIEDYLKRPDNDDQTNTLFGMNKRELLEARRVLPEYLKDPSLIRELLRDSYSMHSYKYAGHEVMIKERIDPSFIQRIVVSNPEIQDELSKYLEECGLIELDQDQRKWILGIPLDQFIVVANHISDDLFAG